MIDKDKQQLYRFGTIQNCNQWSLQWSLLLYSGAKLGCSSNTPYSFCLLIPIVTAQMRQSNNPLQPRNTLPQKDIATPIRYFNWFRLDDWGLPSYSEFSYMAHLHSHRSASMAQTISPAIICPYLLYFTRPLGHFCWRPGLTFSPIFYLGLQERIFRPLMVTQVCIYGLIIIYQHVPVKIDVFFVDTILVPLELGPWK